VPPVTNLENRRRIIVRVNDRGPFVNGRIIDLSAGAAMKLGFYKQGTARVLVETGELES
jgi:rare lipoprotein A